MSGFNQFNQTCIEIGNKSFHLTQNIDLLQSMAFPTHTAVSFLQKKVFLKQIYQLISTNFNELINQGYKIYTRRYIQSVTLSISKG